MRRVRAYTVQDPLAWIIGAEADGHVAIGGQEGDVAARGVVVFEGTVGQVRHFEGAGFLGQENLFSVIGVFGEGGC